MMNEARIGGRAGAAALGYTGYLQALAYARARPQGRPLGRKDPAEPQVPIIEHPDVRRMLLAQKAYVEGGAGAGALLRAAARRAGHRRRRRRSGARRPCCWTCSPRSPRAGRPSGACAANDLAIQVLGGSGYTRDYDVEQHYRDNRLNPIHEGTHGIQGLDLLGRKVLGDAGGAGLRRSVRGWP